jgi:heat shock protein HslJ
MKTTRRLILLILITGILLTACGSTPTLTNTQWRLTQLAGQPALASTEVIMNLADGALNGSDGCNSYGGSYKTSDDKFEVGPDMISTLMACDELIMTQSSAYYQALTQAATFKLAGTKLSLMDSAGSIVAEFETISK